ncbi:MAG TPA: RNA polymerase sigma factor [Methylomirabilota bacterium]|nr:RNA polymerase sigma factor [Methylomirabilota bacterium]
MKSFSLFSITDEQAMWRVQMQDDAEAFALLVERWEGPIQNLCTRMLGDAHRGEDLAQEAFTRVFTKRKDYEPRGKFSTFLWRVALNLCYDELRKRERRRETSLDLDSEDGELGFVTEELSPDISVAREETADGVRAALMRIPETYRSVLVLRHYEDLKFREIADVLAIPEGTVKSRMAEGLSQLARLLEREAKRENTIKSRITSKTAETGRELLVL